MSLFTWKDDTDAYRGYRVLLIKPPAETNRGIIFVHNGTQNKLKIHHPQCEQVQQIPACAAGACGLSCVLSVMVFTHITKKYKSLFLSPVSVFRFAGQGSNLSVSNQKAEKNVFFTSTKYYFKSLICVFWPILYYISS